jgi:hypothetical protein
MVAAPILVAVIMLTQRSDIYYGNAKNISALHILRTFSAPLSVPNIETGN